MKRVAINGFGRIGRLLFRQLSTSADVEVVAINDLGDLENLAYLLQYDSVYHQFAQTVTVDSAAHALVVGGKAVTVLQEKDPHALPWGALNIDIVIECTGLFESFEGASAHLAAGAKRVIISAPAKDDEGSAGGKTIIMGINDDAIATTNLTSNGSCTTNASAPVVAVLSEAIGIEHAMLGTVHAYTGTQSLTDAPVRGGKDFRRGRAAALSISPSTTGAAKTVGKVLPHLEGKFDGLAYRIPVPTGSLSDITFVAKRPTTVEEVNSALIQAVSSERFQGILGIAPDQFVSADIVGMKLGAIVDPAFTKVVDGVLVKVISWYDNEAGYVSTLVRHIEKAARLS
jgi:glyceraldehyde 3-phosphate dehydrogenase